MTHNLKVNFILVESNFSVQWETCKRLKRFLPGGKQGLLQKYFKVKKSRI